MSSPAVQGAAEPRGGAAPAPANAAPQPVADGALRSMTDAELRSEAQRLLRAKDAAAARRALEHLLARPLGVDDRARALASLGSVHLRTGDDVAAEASLQQAVDVLGVAGDEGAWATYELGLLASRREDFAQALRLGEQVARAEGVSVWNRRHGRWLAATMREAMGDVDAARREYRAMLAECGDDPQFGWLVRDLTARLP
ncbi:MAG: tetratricopeptide repeat protein [Planctomycetota bacterium]